MTAAIFTIILLGVAVWWGMLSLLAYALGGAAGSIHGGDK